MYIDTPVKRYSSGMRVRLAFAVAAHLEPDILVVDEVLAVGDAEFQKKAIGKMQDISTSEGRTVLFVSHNMAAVRKLCSNGLVLDQGRIVFKGSSEEAVDFYLNNELDKEEEDLLKRTDRRGTGEIRFSKVELINENGKSVREIISGEKATFRIHMVFNKQIETRKLVFGFVIYDSNEMKIADFYSNEMGVRFAEINNFIELEIPNLLLRGGNYSVVMVVQRAKDGILNQIDLIQNAFQFSVFAGDHWKTGNINRATNVAIIPGIFLS